MKLFLGEIAWVRYDGFSIFISVQQWQPSMKAYFFETIL